jgi:hypothetical protein
MCGHPLQQRGRGDVEADTVGDPRHEIGRCNAVFGIGADGVGAGHSVADTKSRNPIADRGDGAGYLSAEDKGKFVRIQPGPEVRVDEVHAARLGFDQHLGRAGGGPRLVDVGQDFWPTGFGDFDGVHTDPFHCDTRPLSMQPATTSSASWCGAVHPGVLVWKKAGS